MSWDLRRSKSRTQRVQITSSWCSLKKISSRSRRYQRSKTWSCRLYYWSIPPHFPSPASWALQSNFPKMGWYWHLRIWSTRKVSSAGRCWSSGFRCWSWSHHTHSWWSWCRELCSSKFKNWPWPTPKPSNRISYFDIVMAFRWLSGGYMNNWLILNTGMTRFLSLSLSKLFLCLGSKPQV